MGISEFGRRVKKICDRWYVEGGNVLRYFKKDGKFHFVEMLRPITVWEKPYAVGKGFTGPTKVMVIGKEKELRKFGIWDMPGERHLKKLAKAHWQRRRAEHLRLLAALNERREKAKVSNERKFEYETGEFLKDNRRYFSQAADNLGLTRGFVKGV